MGGRGGAGGSSKASGGLKLPNMAASAIIDKRAAIKNIANNTTTAL